MAARRSPTTDQHAVTDLARQLGALLAELDLSEIEVAVGDTRVRLQRARPAPALATAAPMAPTASEGERRQEMADVAPSSTITIEAPMVGTFYRASSPTADPYVREGDVVKVGQVLCIIEAMKLMNEIESTTAGRVTKILVENGQAVEYGHPLFLVEPVG